MAEVCAMGNNPEGHNPRWWRNHPEASVPPLPEPQILPGSPFLNILRRLIGIGFIISGVELMDSRFYWGLVLVIIGFGLLIWEISSDPDLARLPVMVQFALLALCFFGFSVFIISEVKPDSPIDRVCYSPKNGTYPSGTAIAGILWNDHLTELRLGLTNPTEDNYELDLNLHPDSWIRAAALVDNSSGCKLVPLNGTAIYMSANIKGGGTKVTATHIGSNFEVHDNVGDLFSPLLINGGYRLLCDKLAPRLTVEIVFALASLLPAVSDAVLPKPDQARAGPTLNSAEFAGGKSEVDFLGPKPNPSNVEINGQSKRNKQPFSIKLACGVQEGS
jgi:hypothetical protein